MMTRLLILLLLLRVPLFGDAEQDITEVVTTLASALSDGNPQLFLKGLDREMPGYRDVERDVIALSNQALISCSVELLTNTGTASAQTVDLDWYMSLKSQQDDNLIERRRTKVTMKIEKRGKRWVVTSFSPNSIFGPMTVK